MHASGPIGVFDSGFGGLTILREIRKRLPNYDYLYLGDNARAPYGSRSFDLVYRFTLEAVMSLFAHNCPLVILACNTASAKALRSIQQNDLPVLDPSRRVLGVIRPTVEVIESLTTTKHVGILATSGTVNSHSYTLEIDKLGCGISVTEHPCPMWVPLVENGEAESPGADWFVRKYIDEILSRDPLVDTLILACTHYPLLYPKIRAYVPDRIRIVSQGELVAESLATYLERHPEMEMRCSKGGTVNFMTTESADNFDHLASLFMDMDVHSQSVILADRGKK